MRLRKNDSTHWSERAAQMRALALTIKHPETIILMNDFADEYDRFADRAAARLDGKDKAKVAQPNGPVPSRHAEHDRPPHRGQ
jgi:hypothetical protein